MPTSNPPLITFPKRAIGQLIPFADTFRSFEGWFDDSFGRLLYLTLDNFRTIGNEVSGADIAMTWTQPVFNFIWVRYSTQLTDRFGNPLARTMNASDAWAAHHRLALPDYRGRALIGAGQGAGLAPRTKGNSIGAETHVLTVAQMPQHSHSLAQRQRNLYPLTGTQNALTSSADANTFAANYTTGNQGSGQAFNIIQPSLIEHLLMSCGI